jgi:hypothetical protein
MKIIYSVMLACALLLVSSCGTVAHKTSVDDSLHDEVDINTVRFSIGSVQNKTAKDFDVDIIAMMSEELAKELKVKQLFWQDDSEYRVTLNIDIIEYQKGDAFKRWIMPGLGSTILKVQCHVMNQDKLVGTIDAHRSVDAGGAYSAGAWKTVFNGIAQDIVEELEKEILIRKEATQVKKQDPDNRDLYFHGPGAAMGN